MTIALDPKFAKVVRLMRSTTHEGERATARARAEDIARRCGVSFEEAIRAHDAAEAGRSAKPKGGNTAGAAKASPRSYDPDDLDDWMEKQAPGWKAKRSAEKAEKVRAWRIRRAKILARYGSEEAALAPCWRERAILDAVARWRTTRGAPWQRWRDKLDGWRDAFNCRKAPAHIVAAIAGAYPLPTTFAEAKAEHDYWQARSDEMEDVLSTDGEFLGSLPLDLPAEMRAEMVRRLVYKDLPVTTLADLHARFALYRDEEGWRDDEVESALFRDLSAIVDRQRDEPPKADQPRGNRPDLAGQIRAALAADARRSDRWIARALGCSPTTVGAIRREMGLAGARRSVQRGGQVYEMRAKAASRDAGAPA